MMRSRINRCSLILASPAPSAEVWWLAKRKKMKFIQFPDHKPCTVHLINMVNYKLRKDLPLSMPLKDSIEKAIQQQGRVLLFMNRKGFSTFTSCSKCGYSIRCERCNVSLTYLFGKKKMICRYCNATKAVPKICPNCNSSYLQYKGMGIEKLESEIARFYPQARISHFDKDSKTFPWGANIIIATQAILKMKDVFRADIVGVIQVDNELNRMDFRSAHRTFSLLAGLIKMAKERVIVQTRLPDHYCLQAVRNLNFDRFYKKEIALRKESGFPPFKHLVAVMVRGPKEEVALEQADLFYKELCNNNKIKGMEVSEPQPDITPKMRGKYRFMIICKGKSPVKIVFLVRKILINFKKKSGVIITINVD